MGKHKLEKLKKEVKKHLKEDTHEYKEGIADDKALINKMKSKAYSGIKKPMHSAKTMSKKMRGSSRSK